MSGAVCDFTYFLVEQPVASPKPSAPTSVKPKARETDLKSKFETVTALIGSLVIAAISLCHSVRTLICRHLVRCNLRAIPLHPRKCIIPIALTSLTVLVLNTRYLSVTGNFC